MQRMFKSELAEKLVGDRWTISDQVTQLKGIVGFHDMTQDWIKKSEKRIREERNAEIKVLIDRINKLRVLLKKQETGDSDAVMDILKEDREAHLICRTQTPDKIEESLEQMIFRRRKEIDILFYEINDKRKKLYDIRKKVVITSQQEESHVDPHRDYCEQIAAEVECIKTKRDAARIIHESYKKIKGILQKDSFNYEEVLSVLKKDAIIQSEIMLKVLQLGQLATEEAHSTAEKSKKKAKELNKNHRQEVKDVKRLEGMLSQLKQLKEQMGKFPGEHFGLFYDPPPDPPDPEIVKMEQVIDRDTRTLNKIAREVLVLNIEDAYPKVEKVFKDKFDLLRTLQINKIWRDTEHMRRTHIEAMMEYVDHSITDTTRPYVKEEEQLLGELDDIHDKMNLMKTERGKIRGVINQLKVISVQLKSIMSIVNIDTPLYQREEKLVGEEQGIYHRISYENDDGSVEYSTEEDADDPEALQRATEEQEKKILEERKTRKSGGMSRSGVPGVQESPPGEEAEESEEEEFVEPMAIIDFVKLKLKLLKDQLGDEAGGKDTDEEGLDYLGEYYEDYQSTVDAELDILFSGESHPMKRYKPKSDVFEHRKCRNKSRMDIKLNSGKIVFKAEAPPVMTEEVNFKPHSCY